MDIAELLAFTLKQGASDLHLSAGMPPMLRVDGDIRRVNLPALDLKAVQSLIYEVMNDAQRKNFEEHWDIDFSIELPKLARFRVNVYQQNRGLAAAFRLIPNGIQSLEAINAPEVLRDICEHNNGLVLVTGPTGSGKSTTLAAMIDYINQHKNLHILTIEDPIEFVHQSKKSLINQREVFRDTRSFNNALRSALREDPDVILVGELRDLESIRLALTAAETGHLVMATLHTNSAAKTIDRIIDVFPAEEKAMVRAMLSESLRAVVTQILLKRIDGGRAPAFEVLRATPAVRNLIREEKIAQIYSVMQTGVEDGMNTMDQSLLRLVERNVVARAEARPRAVNKGMFG